MDRTWVKGIVYPLVGLLSFFFFIWLTLPEEELGDIAKRQAESALGGDYDVEFGEFGLSGLTGVEAEQIRIASRPPPPGLSEEELAEYERVVMNIDRVEIDAYLLRSIFDNPGAGFEIEIGGGVIEGEYLQEEYEPVTVAAAPRTVRRRTRTPARAGSGDDDKAKDEDADEEEDEEGDEKPIGHRIVAKITELPLNSLSIIRAKIGLPLVGTVDGDIDLLVGKRGEFVDGRVKLMIQRVALGPGIIADFEIKQAARIGTITIDAKAEDGKLVVEQIRTTGPDIVVEANGLITSGRTFKLSTLKFNVRVKPSKEFLDRTKLSAALSLDPKIKRAQSGEWFGVLVRGPITKPDPYPSSRTAQALPSPTGTPAKAPKKR